MAVSLQHNTWMSLADLPDLDEIKESLFREEICDKRVEITVKNPRYIVEVITAFLVSFEAVRRDRHMPGLWRFDGDILRVNGEAW